MRRVILIGGLVVVVVVAAAVYFLLTSLDAIVKAAIERYGSEITQTEVRLDRAEIRPREGTGALIGLRMGNPQGFETDHALELGQVRLELDVQSLTRDPIVIREIRIERPSVSFEVGRGGSNLAAIQRNVESYTGSGAKPSEPGGETADEAAGPKLVIEHVHIREGRIQVSAAGLGGKAMSTNLPDIHLKDIGQDGDGATPAQVARTILDALTRNVGSAVGKLGLEGALGEAARNLESTTEAMRSGAQGAAEETRRKAQETIEKGVGETSEKLKDLFR